MLYICSMWTLIHVSECGSYHPRVGMGEMEDPLRLGNGEPSRGLRFWSRCLYLGLYLIQRWRASQASGCCPVLVRLTARAIRAFRLFGCSSKHLFEQRQIDQTWQNKWGIELVQHVFFFLLIFPINGAQGECSEKLLKSNNYFCKYHLLPLIVPVKL